MSNSYKEMAAGESDIEIINVSETDSEDEKPKTFVAILGTVKSKNKMKEI